MVDNVGRLRHLDSASVADAMSGFGVLDPRICSRTPGLKLVGRALTVKCYPGSIITVHRALVQARHGDVLIIDGEGDGRAGALIGELMAREALDRGIRGVVVDGAVRDVVGLQSLSFPTFSSSVTPRVGVNRRLGHTRQAISIGGVVVHSGDYVIADDDGVVIVPLDRVEAITSGAEQIEAKERTFAGAIDRHERLVDLLQFHSLIGDIDDLMPQK